MNPLDLKRMTKLELFELARNNNLRVTSTMTKAELIDTIQAAEKRSKTKLKPIAKETISQKSDEKRKIGKSAKKVSAAGERSSTRKKTKLPTETAAPGAGEPESPERTIPRATKKAAPARKEPFAGSKMIEEAAKSAQPQEIETEKTASKRAPKKSIPALPRAKAAAKRIEPTKKPTDEDIRRMAEEGKYYLGAEQRIMPAVEAIEIPSGYNVDRIVVLVRDPFWIFAYWEITDRKRHELERLFGDMWSQCRMVLRVYDLTEKRREHFDITLTSEARNWYINVSAARRYQVAIGALSADGRFEQIAISNIVETPSGRVSDRVDEQWMIPDEVFDKIFAASGGLDMHASSAELRGLMERHLLEQITSGSGAISSFGSGAWPARKGRRFRLWVATELVLYGGTDPDAKVTVQGKEVKLRPDGTFSLRFALPDGKLDLPVEAESADGIETRRIETGVTKKSTTKEPVVK